MKNVYIFLYNVVYIKSDFSKIKSKLNHSKLILIGSGYCLNQLSVKNRSCFDNIHQISRDFQQMNLDEVEKIVCQYVEEYGAKNVKLMTNEDSTQIGCAYLRNKYGIIGYNETQLLPFVNKVFSKNKLGDVVRMPKFIKFDKEQYLQNKIDYILYLEKTLGFPMFVKPIDLVSSVETHYIPDMERLKCILERIVSHPYDFEVDEYIEGDLFHCDAMIINGEVKFFMVGKCSFALARFFEGKPVGSIPIIDESMFQKLQEFCIKVFKKLDCHDSAYHLEAFLEKKSQEFVFLEIGARTGGALLTKVYEKVFDMNIEETNYLIQMNLIDEIKIPKKNIFAGFLNFPKIKGTVLNIERPSIDIEHDFIEFVQKGDILKQAENLLDISCSIIFWDKSYQNMANTFEYLKNYKPLEIVN